MRERAWRAAAARAERDGHRAGEKQRKETGPHGHVPMMADGAASGGVAPDPM